MGRATPTDQKKICTAEQKGDRSKDDAPRIPQGKKRRKKSEGLLSDPAHSPYNMWTVISRMLISVTC